MCDLVAGAQAEFFLKRGHLLDLESGQGRKVKWSVILRLYAVGRKKKFWGGWDALATPLLQGVLLMRF